MDGKMLARLGAVVFVAIAVTATAIDMTRKDEPSAPPAGAGPPAAEPIRCAKACAAASSSARPPASDADCLAVWAETRDRFLGRRPQRGALTMGNTGVIDNFLGVFTSLHRQRVRPARRRGRLHRHHADRHRRDARRAVLGLGRG